MRALCALVWLVLGIMTSSAAATETSGVRPIVIVTDAGYFSDDSIAILALIQSGRFDVRALITTAGNVTARESRLALERLLREAGRSDIPIVEGPSMAVHAARWRHYSEHERPSWPRSAYVGAFNTRTAPAPHNSDADARAAAFLMEQAAASRGELTIVLLGPATVLAQALAREGALPVAGVIAMGGAFDVAGNVTRAAEFNIWFDPEAMEAVLRAGLPFTFVPLDATSAVQYAKLSGGEPASVGLRHLRSFLDGRGGESRRLPMWDEVVAAMMLDPSLVTQSYRAEVSVDVGRAEHYGRTSSERTEDGAVLIVSDVDAKRVEAVLRATLAR